MKKKDKEIFIQFAHDYAQRFRYCFCHTTGEKYPSTFAKFKYWRFVMELEDKYDIIIKTTDTKAYKEYEDIMLSEINGFIEESKVEYKERMKQQKKKEKEKKDKGIK